MRRAHSGFLKLLEWQPGFHALVLARVAHENHTVMLIKPIQKISYMASAGQTGLIYNVKIALFTFVRTGPGKMALQSV